MKIELRNIRKSYGTTPVIQDVSLSIEPNEFFFLLGPSGCGKTTLLRMLAGFIAPDTGDIVVDGRRINDSPPEQRRMPMVFQSYALWPHLTVFENVAYGLRVQGLPQDEIKRRTSEVLEITRMTSYRDRSPNQLSGGQQQRVAISRAMAVNPDVLLFDEPLSNLDARLRLEMREEILEIHQRRPFTAIYVTHDQEEAMTMATRIAVLDRGKIQQLGSPYELYARPKSRLVAEFMGTMNWIPVRAKESPAGNSLILDTPLGTWKTGLVNFSTVAGQELLLGFRPSAVRLDGVDSGAVLRMSCETLQVQYTGGTQRLIVKPCGLSGNSSDLRFQITEVNPRQIRKVGEQVKIEITTGDMVVVPS